MWKAVGGACEADDVRVADSDEGAEMSSGRVWLASKQSASDRPPSRRASHSNRAAINRRCRFDSTAQYSTAQLQSNSTEHSYRVCHVGQSWLWMLQTRGLDRLVIIIVLGLVVDDVEEAQLIDSLGRRHHAQPVAQLLLLEELLRPVARQ